MNPSYKNIHVDFKLNKAHYSHSALYKQAEYFVNEGKPFEQAIGEFLKDWLDESDTISVQTSGSTGTPKQVNIKKQAMVNSALATGVFFNLKSGNIALLCLPSHYIAGKMMLVRALVLGLELDVVEPTLELEFNLEIPYDFCAMIPLQLQKTLRKCKNIKTIIVGGAPLSNTLKRRIKNIDSNVYETYGMTETVTHIALKKVNNILPVQDKSTKIYTEPYFKTLPNITISRSKNDCLIIDAPLLNPNKIITNDIVNIYNETEFEWLGRFDNVINTGGIKVFPEQIEKKLQPEIKQRFFIASEADSALGHIIILLLESNSNTLNKNVFNGLGKYEKPKKIYAVKHFEETASGKIQRKKTLKKINL